MVRFLAEGNKCSTLVVCRVWYIWNDAKVNVKTYGWKVSNSKLRCCNTILFKGFALRTCAKLLFLLINIEMRISGKLSKVHRHHHHHHQYERKEANGCISIFFLYNMNKYNVRELNGNTTYCNSITFCD